MIRYWSFKMPPLDKIDCLQPNLKKGYGRLRTVNQICWLGRILYDIEEMNSLRALKGLHARGVISTSQEHLLQRAFIFFTEAMYQLYLLDYDDFTRLPETGSKDRETVCRQMGLADFSVFASQLREHTYNTCRIWFEIKDRFI